jgi:invasion protein IalB
MHSKTLALVLITPFLTSVAWSQSKAVAPADKPKLEKFDNWTKVCVAPRKDAPKGAKASCHLEQAFAAPRSESKQPILVWRVSLNDQKEAMALVLTPNNVLLGRGVQFGMAADKSTVVPFFTCRPGFCELRFKLEADLVKSLGARDTVPVVFNMVNNDQISMAVPMQGFAKGIESLKK